MTEVSMTVNGAAVTREVADNTSMVVFLREHLGLTGTHVGCDTSQCGACLIHVDDQPVKACTLFALEADGAQVTTIEGIAGPDGTLSAVQQAFRDQHGLQCGYCTPGMVMALTALLRENPKPTVDEIRHYLKGNICRCTGYHNLVKAALAASGQDAEAAVAAE